MEYFVAKDSIVREIWGKSDTVLLVFAGSAAEFALNKAVDWLYFTGKLPKDPLGRLFSTVTYARRIVFSELEEANKAIDQISAIHAAVENARGSTIPQWAYRDVLYMLIDYSIRSYELLERKLSNEEKETIYDVFLRIGQRMQIEELPPTFVSWLPARQLQLQNDLAKGHLTVDLYKQYKKHLGAPRYKLLLEGQKLVVPETVRELLELNQINYMAPLLSIFRFSRKLHLDQLIKIVILPSKYRKEIKAIDYLEK